MAIFALVILFQSKAIDKRYLFISLLVLCSIEKASEHVKDFLFLAKGSNLSEYVMSNQIPGLYH